MARLALPPVIDNYAPFISALLTIERKPMSLVDHFVFNSLFSTLLPVMMVWKTGRQLGKTVSISARLILQAAAVSGHKTLVVLPLQDQSDNLSSVVFKPLIESSPIRSILGIDTTIGSVRRRQFANGSIIHFLYAWLDVERLRGRSARWLYIDEAQDMDPTFVPTIKECASSYPDPLMFVSGTSKSKGTYLERSWEKSSQGVWHTKCSACGFDNSFALEPDGHLLSIIGPVRDDISEARPGTLCHRCRTPINPRHGRWVHRYPERKRDQCGYFVPQPTMPIHCTSPVKWAQLIGKMNGNDGYTTAKFYNEVLGEAYDSAYKLVSEDDLKAVAHGIGPNILSAAINRSSRYKMIILGVDWGGGGEEGVSRTKVAGIGFLGNGNAEVFFGAQFQPSTDAMMEGRDVIKIAAAINAQIIAHDYNGAAARESVINSLGWPINRIAPLVYRQVIGGEMIEFHKPVKQRTRGYYVLDKGRTVQFVCMAIRAKRISFFDYDYQDENNPGLINDFTALVEDKVDTPTGTAYRIRKIHETASDDFAHACVYGCVAGWELTGGWPDLTRVGTINPYGSRM